MSQGDSKEQANWAYENGVTVCRQPGKEAVGLSETEEQPASFSILSASDDHVVYAPRAPDPRPAAESQDRATRPASASASASGTAVGGLGPRSTRSERAADDPVLPFDQNAAGDARSVFEWTQAVAVGHPEIDEDHKRLLLLLQELQSAHEDKRPEIVGDALRRLEEYTRVHFSREEKMMTTFNYPDIARHKREHAAFITKLSVVKGNIGDHIADLERIVTFLFDWLVKHINTVDRAMVDRMRGGKVTFSAGAVNAQTNLVIDAAYALAISIERMSTQLGHIVDPGQRERLRREIGDASDRLCNMVALADGRVGELGGSPSQQQRLSGLRTAMINASSRLIEGSAHRLSRYAKSILDGRRGLPYGIGDALHQRLNNIVTLVEMAGGFDSVNESAHEAIREAVDAVNGCLEMESHQANLPTYEGPAPAARVAFVVPPRKPAPPKAAPPVPTPTPTPTPTPPPSAASQQDVLNAAKRRPG